MFFRHATRKLTAYCHDELSAEESRWISQHLLGCSRCRSDYELIKLGVSLAEQLPRVAAPDTLWSDLDRRFEANEGVTKSSEQVYPRPLFRQPRFAVVAASLILLIVLTVLLLYRRDAGPSWEVASLDGAPQIGSRRIGDKGRLGLGQWLETDGESRAQINVSQIGQVEIDPNTRVRLLATKPTEHRLELARGRMSARIWAPPKLFFVDTPSAVAADLGCAYTLEVDDHGGSLLHVTLGWVALQLRDRESVVPSGAACATRKGIGPGTPYFEDASEEFRQALRRVDFENNPNDPNSLNALATVLATARVRDTLTLWHLLARLDGKERALVFERLAELVPPPEGVTREGVMALNQEMLDLWKAKLEASWGNYSAPAMKMMKKIWTSGLGKINGLEGKK